MHVALFGGSFDPPHLGHVLAATWAFAVGGVDEVWVLPVARHAFAKPISPWEQRWTLCQAAFGGLGFVRLRDDELRNGAGYTWDLLAGLRAAHPGNRWSLVGGTDTHAEMTSWHRGDELLRVVEVIAVPRRGFDDQHPAALPGLSSSLVRERLRRGESVAGLVPAGVMGVIGTMGWYR